MADNTEQQATPAQAAPTQAQPAQPAVPQVDNSEPAWLPARLARAQEAAQKELLAKLGIDDAEKAKAFIKAGQDAENERKTLAEKLAEQAAQLTTTKTQADKLSAVVALQAASQLSTLSPEQQAAVKAIAGEDPAEQLRTVIALAPTWAAKAAAQAVTPVVPAPAPASTSPAPAAPPGVSPGSPPDHKAVYQQLLNANPISAARYAAAHPSVFSD